MFWKATRLLLVAFAIGSAVTGCSEDDPVSTSGKPALTTFARTYGDDTFSFGLSVQPTIDGGYVVTRRTGSTDFYDGDFVILKIDARGDTVCARVYGDQLPERGHAVRELADGGFIVTGYRDDPYTDLWLFKTNASGEMVWEQVYGGADEDRGYRVELVGDGRYVVVGSTESFGAARSQVWILKTDAAGRVPEL